MEDEKLVMQVEFEQMIEEYEKKESKSRPARSPR